jgi:hypothetical protein
MGQELGTLIVYAFMGLGVLAACLYFVNIYRIITAIRTQNYTIVLFLRFVGVFMPIWGVVMGLVNEK